MPRFGRDGMLKTVSHCDIGTTGPHRFGWHHVPSSRIILHYRFSLERELSWRGVDPTMCAAGVWMSRPVDGRS